MLPKKVMGDSKDRWLTATKAFIRKNYASVLELRAGSDGCLRFYNDERLHKV